MNVTYLRKYFLLSESIFKVEIWLVLQEFSSNSPVRFFFCFLATKYVARCRPYVLSFLLGIEMNKDVLLLVPLYQFHTLSEYPWWLWILCYADLYYTDKSQLSLSNFYFYTIFQTLIWEFSELEVFWLRSGIVLYLRQNSHLSNCDHSRVNVCVYQTVQKSVAEKIK